MTDPCHQHFELHLKLSYLCLIAVNADAVEMKKFFHRRSQDGKSSHAVLDIEVNGGMKIQ